MSFTLEALTVRRSFLYHLTDSRNLQRIRTTRHLESASRIFHAAGEGVAVRTRRRAGLIVEVDGVPVYIRDQAPLHAGNMQLERGWAFEDFVAHLNARVFFWPGNDTGPISYGVRHYQRYAEDCPVILRVPTRALFSENAGRVALFCRWNSGSPRCTYGRKSPRTAKTFVDADDADYRASQVVEVTFEDLVCLPESTQLGDVPWGPWRALFTEQG
jgi:hypothetical protein